MAMLRRVLLVAALAPLAGCAAAMPAGTPPCCGEGSGSACAVPAFGCDGRVKRDLPTDAPLFVARSEALAGRAPRFEDDGTVARDPETGLPLYEERVGGVVARVFVALP